MVVGIAVLATNLVAAAWGAIGWARKDAQASIMFWPLLRAAQATVVVEAVVGLLLVARGASAPDGLHIAYGIAPLIVSLVSEGMRVAVAQRELEGVEDVDALDHDQIALAKRVALGEMGVMTVGALLILTLARGVQTEWLAGQPRVPEPEHHSEYTEARHGHGAVDRLDRRPGEHPAKPGGARGHRDDRHRREYRERRCGLDLRGQRGDQQHHHGAGAGEPVEQADRGRLAARAQLQVARARPRPSIDHARRAGGSPRRWPSRRRSRATAGAAP